jgi:hypothetical protein
MKFGYEITSGHHSAIRCDILGDTIYRYGSNRRTGKLPFIGYALEPIFVLSARLIEFEYCVRKTYLMTIGATYRFNATTKLIINFLYPIGLMTPVATKRYAIHRFTFKKQDIL